MPEFEPALAKVATFVAPTGMSQGHFVLKKESWRQFDLYFPLYSLPELHRAQERSLRFLQPEAPPPTPPTPCPAFSGLTHAACNGGLHAVVYAVCYAAVRKGAAETPVSERLLATALRLMQLTVVAHEANQEAMAAVEAADAAAFPAPPLAPPSAPPSPIFGAEEVRRAW